MEVVDKTGLLAENPIDLSYGVTIQDLDGDGVPEIFVATQRGANHLFRQVEGRYYDMTPALLQDADFSALGVAAADMTGNGLPDLYIANTDTFAGAITEPDRLFINRGDFQFDEFLTDHPDRNIGSSRSVVWFDPLGNLRYGLFVVNMGAPNRMFLNDPLVGFRNIAPVAHGLGIISGGRSLVAQDIRGIGRMDLLVLNEQAPNLFFRNLGQGVFRECAEDLGLADVEGHARGVQVCDLDRDGRVEFLWANWEGHHRWMQETPEGTYRDQASYAWAKPSKARTVIVADFDNDGWEEVFLNNIDEPNRLFRMVEGRMVEIDPGPMLLPDGAGTGASVGDLDGDGWLELFVCHGESMPQRNRIFACAPNGNHWVRIAPLTPAGAPAIGARVTVQHRDGPMIRFIDGGSGYLCQMEPIAHFGLGRDQDVPVVRVLFSDGDEVTLKDLAIDTVHRVPHPRTPGFMTSP